MGKILNNKHISGELSGRTSSRNSNIELLRVLSMLMIVAYHYVIFGFYAEDIMYSPNKYFVDIFGMGGKIGTDLFVLISGYYMINSRFTLKKLLRVAGQVWFYSVAAFIVFALVGGLDTVRGMERLSFLPLLSSHYWFASYYVLLIIFSPFLNALIHGLDKKQHGQLCVFLFLLCCVIPELLHISFASGALPLFVSLYVCAAYCRLHISHGPRVANRSMLLLVVFMLICISRIVICDFLWQRAGNAVRLVNSVEFMGAYSPFAFVIAMMLLLAACCRAPGRNRFIAALGGLSFGVYLCHSNQLVGSVLWQEIFKTSSFGASPWLFVHAVVTVAVVFAACCIVELLRQIFIEPLWERFCNWICPATEDGLDKGFTALIHALHWMIGDTQTK